MLNKYVVLFLMTFLLHANAQDTDGSLMVDGQATRLTYCYAHLHDNPEKVLSDEVLMSDQPQMRIAIVNKPQAQNVLSGRGVLLAEHMANMKQLEGVLIKFNPNKMNESEAWPWITILKNGTTSTSVKNAIQISSINEHEISGSLSVNEHYGGTANATFKCVVTKEEPLTADLKGVTALKSPQMTTLKLVYRAIAKNQLDIYDSYNSKAIKDFTDFLFGDSPEVMDLVKKAVAAETYSDIKGYLSMTPRVIVRGNRASIIFDGEDEMFFIFEDGVWKLDF